MSEAATGQPESLGKKDITVLREDAKEFESLMRNLEHFSRLSSDLQVCLSDVALRIKNSIDELNKIENDLLKREQVLKKKEQEWDRLVKELELFMTSLLTQARKESTDTAPHKPDLKNGDPPVKRNAPVEISGPPETVSDGKEMSGIERRSDGTVNSSVESIREMLLSQERRIESIHAYLKGNLKEPSSESHN